MAKGAPSPLSSSGPRGVAAGWKEEVQVKNTRKQIVTRASHGHLTHIEDAREKGGASVKDCMEFQVKDPRKTLVAVSK